MRRSLAKSSDEPPVSNDLILSNDMIPSDNDSEFVYLMRMTFQIPFLLVLFFRHSFPC